MNGDQLQSLAIILVAASTLGAYIDMGRLRRRVAELETEMRRFLMRRRP